MRSREQVIRDFVSQWLGKAEADLAAAEILAGRDLDDYFTSAFHSQQAAEKLLKAFLVRHQIEFRKTHDLSQLLHLAGQADPSLQEALDVCTWLTPFGADLLYPGEYPEVDRSTAQKALRDARRIRQEILARLDPYLAGERDKQ